MSLVIGELGGTLGMWPVVGSLGPVPLHFSPVVAHGRFSGSHTHPVLCESALHLYWALEASSAFSLSTWSSGASAIGRSLLALITTVMQQSTPLISCCPPVANV